MILLHLSDPDFRLFRLFPLFQSDPEHRLILLYRLNLWGLTDLLLPLFLLDHFVR